MATLIAKVRQVTGSVVGDVPDDLIVQALDDAQGFVLASLPLDILQTSFRGQTASVADGTGIDVTGEVVLGAERNGREAEIKPLDGFYATETAIDSIYKPTKLFPFAFIKNNLIFLKPDPVAGELGLCAIAKDVTVTSISTTFLGKYESIGMNFACYIDYMHQFAIYAAKADTNILLVTASGGYLDDFVAALPTYNSVAEPTLPSPPSVSIAYTAPNTALPSGIVMDEVLPVVVLPATPTLPTVPTIAIAYTEPAGGAPAGVLTLTKSLSSISMPVSPSLDFTNFTDALTNAKNLIDVGLTNESSLAHSSGYWLNDEDPEMVQANNQTASQEAQRANSELSKQKILIDEYGASVDSEAKRISTELGEYQAEVTKEVSRLDQLLKTYSAEQKDSSGVLQAQIETARSDIANYSAEVQAVISEYSASSDVEVKRVGFELQKYGAEVEKKARDADIAFKAFSAEQQDASAELQAQIETARVNISAYGAEVGAKIQEYSALVQAESSRFGGELAKAKAYLEAANTLQITINGSLSLAQQFSQNGVAMFKIARESLDSVINNSRGQQVAQ